MLVCFCSLKESSLSGIEDLYAMYSDSGNSSEISTRSSTESVTCLANERQDLSLQPVISEYLVPSNCVPYSKVYMTSKDADNQLYNERSEEINNPQSEEYQLIKYSTSDNMDSTHLVSSHERTKESISLTGNISRQHSCILDPPQNYEKEKILQEIRPIMLEESAAYFSEKEFGGSNNMQNRRFEKMKKQLTCMIVCNESKFFHIEPLRLEILPMFLYTKPVSKSQIQEIKPAKSQSLELCVCGKENSPQNLSITYSHDTLQFSKIRLYPMHYKETIHMKKSINTLQTTSGRTEHSLCLNLLDERDTANLHGSFRDISNFNLNHKSRRKSHCTIS